MQLADLEERAKAAESSHTERLRVRVHRLLHSQQWCTLADFTENPRMEVKNLISDAFSSMMSRRHNPCFTYGWEVPQMCPFTHVCDLFGVFLGSSCSS